MSASLYLSQSSIGSLATPLSIAALAMAGGISEISLGSNGLGIIYSLLKANLVSPYAIFTCSGTGSLAKSAKAFTAAIFIASLIFVARTSKAPLNIKGKPKTLFTWFGWSERPVAIIISFLVSIAKSYAISGSGLAMAKTMGLSAIEVSIDGVTMSAIDSPTKTSAFTIASSKVSIFLAVANSSFSEDKLGLSFLITPLLSNMTIFSAFAPKALYSLVQETAAAPAPLITIRTFSIDFSAKSNAFKSAAAAIIAVPCWSSCMTGISNSSFNLLSISKASGALISSRLIPPKVGAMVLTV